MDGKPEIRAERSDQERDRKRHDHRVQGMSENRRTALLGRELLDRGNTLRLRRLGHRSSSAKLPGARGFAHHGDDRRRTEEAVGVDKGGYLYVMVQPVRRMLRGVAWVALFLGVALLAVFAHLGQAVARRAVADTIERQVSSTVQGSLEIGELSQLSLRRIRLEDVVVRGPTGAEALRVQDLRLYPAIRPILRGTMALHKLEVRNAYVNAQETEQGARVIQAALEPIEPTPPEEQPAMQVDEIDLRDISADAGPARIENMKGVVRMQRPEGQEPTIELHSFTGDVDLEAPVPFYVGFRDFRGRYRGPDGLGAAEGMVLLADEEMRVIADYKEARETPVRVRLHTDAISLSTLAALGVDVGTEFIDPVRGDLSVDFGRDLAIEGALEDAEGRPVRPKWPLKRADQPGGGTETEEGEESRSEDSEEK